jgi:predicted DCC family thiol-disulfide oxidoreductase YuxK
MGAPLVPAPGPQSKPVLLFDDECGVCRRIASWVRRSALGAGGSSAVIVRPIGEDPAALRALNPALDIWDAYDTIHLVMPDGSMKLGGQAVAELLRTLPNTRWFARCFAFRLFGWKPFQRLLDLGYAMLSAVRPVLGCESCGAPSPWLKPLAWAVKKAKSGFAPDEPRPAARHFTPR